MFGLDFYRFLSAIVGKATPLILVGQKAERSGVLAFNWLFLSPLSFYPDFQAMDATHLHSIPPSCRSSLATSSRAHSQVFLVIPGDN